ncbi:MAG: xanthine dehydrogenase family protein molybdopterin-binding subunit, partial [Rhodospirillaceae bacterium]
MTIVGQGIDRTDGPLKVRGEARYAGDFSLPGLAHAVIVQSTIAKGTIASVDTAPAMALPGVLTVLTHRDAPKLPQGGKAAVKPPAGRVMSLLQDDTVQYNGQPIAVVVADTFEHALAAADAVRVRYRIETPQLDFERAKAKSRKPESLPGERPPDQAWGDPDRALASAPVRVEATYTTPMETHNPMEPHATVAAWDGDRLTLYDA